MGTSGFAVAEIESLELERKRPLSEKYTLSPFVWRQDPEYDLLVRAVNRSKIAAEKVARAYYGHSRDGLRFIMGDHPVISPGPAKTTKTDAKTRRSQSWAGDITSITRVGTRLSSVGSVWSPPAPTLNT